MWFGLWLFAWVVAAFLAWKKAPATWIWGSVWIGAAMLTWAAMDQPRYHSRPNAALAKSVLWRAGRAVEIYALVNSDRLPLDPSIALETGYRELGTNRSEVKTPIVMNAALAGKTLSEIKPALETLLLSTGRPGAKTFLASDERDLYFGFPGKPLYVTADFGRSNYRPESDPIYWQPERKRPVKLAAVASAQPLPIYVLDEDTKERLYLAGICLVPLASVVQMLSSGARRKPDAARVRSIHYLGWTSLILIVFYAPVFVS